MSVKVESFGFMPDGREAKLIVQLKSGQGFNDIDREQERNVNKHFKNIMKQTLLIIFILFSIFNNSFSQTDSLIILKYKTLKEWEDNSKNKTSFIDNHFKGGYDNFHKIILSNLNSNTNLHNICSAGNLLFNLVFENGNVTIKFANIYWEKQQENLLKVIKELDTFWIDLPIKKQVYNFSISYIYHLDNETLKGEEGASFEINTYFEKVSGEYNSCECLFKNNLQIEKQLTYAIELKEYEIAIIFMKELMRRQPFNKEFYNHFISISQQQYKNK